MKQEQSKKMSKIIAKCWSNEAFKKKLLADPATTLKTEGVELQLPAGLSVKVLENDDKVFHLVIPAKPTDLWDEELPQIGRGGKRRRVLKRARRRRRKRYTPVNGTACVMYSGTCDYFVY
jgi:Nitrile hydratase, alpha chain